MNSLDMLSVRVLGPFFSRVRTDDGIATVRANCPVAECSVAEVRALARASASATLKLCVLPDVPCEAHGFDELERRLGALEILPVLPAFEAVVVRGILEVLAFGIFGDLPGFAEAAGLDAPGVLSALGVCAGWAPGCLTDLRAVGLKAELAEAGFVRLLGSGLLVESVTCARLSHRAICDC